MHLTLHLTRSWNMHCNYSQTDGGMSFEMARQALELGARWHNTCGCLNWQNTGSVERISLVLCRHEQMLIPIVDRVVETL